MRHVFRIPAEIIRIRTFKRLKAYKSILKDHVKQDKSKMTIYTAA
jgi:hypothetical protein